MQSGIFETLKLIGSLGFFIYGMKIMSEGIQKAAGDQLRTILGYMTTNRVSGIFTGFITTSLVQSSSATTVMVVGFVNASLLSLRQAIGVIMGANIGTTITGILIVAFGFSKFSIATYALPIIAVGFPLMFVKGQRLKSLGEFFIGFALLFMGLSALKNSVPDPNDYSMQWITDLANLGYISIIIFVLIGTALTIVVQSSSAAMALTLTLCMKGLIPLDIAAAIVLGENIGTTITANLAALVGNTNAKRAARAHFIFNCFGVVWMLFLFYPFLNLVQYVVSTHISPELVGGNTEQQRLLLSSTLTGFHVTFNVVNTSLMVWFVPLIERVVVKMVPDRSINDGITFKYIGVDVFRTDELSGIINVRKELTIFAQELKRMSATIIELLNAQPPAKQDKLLSTLAKQEHHTDEYAEAISNYVLRLIEGELSEGATKQIKVLLGQIDDLERAGDLFYEIGIDIKRTADKGFIFSDGQLDSLKEAIALLDKAVDVMVENLNEVKYEDIELNDAATVEEQLNHLTDVQKQGHLDYLQAQDNNLKQAMVYKDIFYALERIGNFIFQVSRASAESSEQTSYS